MITALIQFKLPEVMSRQDVMTEWRAMFTARYGGAARIAGFEMPIVVDNASGEVIGGAGE
jgi:hypothetical protein